MARVFAVASAKGGVGKTTTTANLGAILAETGADVVVIDGDIGMANLGAALGIESPPTTLHDVLSGEATPSEATYEGPGGVYVVPGDTALSSYAPADPEELPSVLRTHSQADYVLIDVGAGVSHETSLPLSLADEVLLVSTPERDALRDTEKTRQLTEQLGGTVAGAVITRTEASTPVSELATGRLAATVLASIPEDEAVRDALAVGEPLSTHAPHSPAATAYRELVAELTGVEPEAPPEPASRDTPPASTADDTASDTDTIDSTDADSTGAAPEQAAPDQPDPDTPATADPEQVRADDPAADAAAAERPSPESESKWAEAATGTGVDLDDQIDAATARSEAGDDAVSDTETAAPADSSDESADADAPSASPDESADADGPSASATETPASPTDADESTPATTDVDESTPAAADEGVTPEPTTETITERATEADEQSPVADVAEGITPAPSPSDDDTTATADGEQTAAPNAAAADPDESAVPFRDADADSAEMAADEPAAEASTSAADEPLIPDAEGEAPSTAEEDASAMTTELGAAADSADDDTADDDDEEQKGFFRRLFFG